MLSVLGSVLMKHLPDNSVGGLVVLLSQKLRGLIQRYGTPTMKRRLWDNEFSSGRWDCLDDMRGDCLYPLLESHADGLCILDLGCGPGTTANEINAKYTWYTGVDISEVTLIKARERSQLNGRADRCEFLQSDIASFTPQRSYDTIIFADSLYYVPQNDIPQLLKRYSGYLSAKGLFIARIKGVRPEWFDCHASITKERGHWGRRKAIVSTILSNFSVVEQQLFYHSDIICVIAFRPRSIENESFTITEANAK